MAALVHVVVVVECHHRGGSLHTVAAALARGVTVTAVPGSVRSPASAGTNRLLVEGAAPVRDVDDVLTAVELAVVGHRDITPPRRPPVRRAGRAQGVLRPLSEPVPSRVRRALDQDPATLDVVVRRSGLPLGEVSLALEEPGRGRARVLRAGMVVVPEEMSRVLAPPGLSRGHRP